mmetsp:Transcript_30433/g.63544  ORF Transcript_30433/g.63544 Transcript_30433/m.63544 type:complete len:89 (-) Transcript_30433:12-278(-)
MQILMCESQTSLFFLFDRNRVANGALEKRNATFPLEACRSQTFPNRPLQNAILLSSNRGCCNGFQYRVTPPWAIQQRSKIMNVLLDLY